MHQKTRKKNQTRKRPLGFGSVYVYVIAPSACTDMLGTSYDINYKTQSEIDKMLTITMFDCIPSSTKLCGKVQC